MERVGFLLQVKEGRQSEYLKAHEPGVIWPSIVESCRRAGMRNYSGWLGGEGMRQVFGYFETKDLQASLVSLRSDPDNLEWQRHMAPLMEHSGEGNGESMKLLRPAFYLP